MKKLIITLTFICFLSCVSDENENQTNDPIIGKWNWSELNDSGTPITIPECEKETSLTFNIDKTFLFDIFEQLNSNPSLPCTQGNGSNGNWENLGNQKYRFFNSTESAEFKVTFPNSNTLVLTDSISPSSYTINTYIKSN